MTGIHQTLRFSMLDRFLRNLGFEKIVVPNSHTGYVHPDSDAVFMFRLYRQDDSVSELQQSSVRTLLIDRGLINQEDWNALVPPKREEIAFAVLDDFLRKLGFEKIVRPRHIGYVHPNSDVKLMFRVYKPNNLVDWHDQTSVQTLLIDRGHIEPEEWDELLNNGTLDCSPRPSFFREGTPCTTSRSSTKNSPSR